MKWHKPIFLKCIICAFEILRLIFLKGYMFFWDHSSVSRDAFMPIKKSIICSEKKAFLIWENMYQIRPSIWTNLLLDFSS